LNRICHAVGVIEYIPHKESPSEGLLY